MKYFYPSEWKTIEADNKKEADKKLKDILTPKKTKNVWELKKDVLNIKK